jgi:type VII secretion-associated serine protease mycosin
MRLRAPAAALAALLVALVAPATAAATPPVPDTTRFYWFGNYQIAKVWALGATGQGQTVAVLDTGVQASEPELRGVVLPGTDFNGGNGQTDTDTPDGHGSAMARFIAAQGGGRWGITGIAPGVKILPVTTNNKFAAIDDSIQVTRGIRYAVDHGAKIINLSQGTPDACPAEVGDAVRYAIGKGAVVVAAAGNEGNTTNQALFPADCPGVLAVGAVDGAKRPWEQTQRQPYVDVAAPGVDMFNENLAGDSGTSDGTSESTALVSGVIALVWSKFPSLTARQVVARVLATVTDDAVHPGKDEYAGYGIARPYDAIVTNVPADAPNPVFDELNAAPSSSAGLPSAVTFSRNPTASVPAPAATSSSGSNTGLLVGIVGAALVVVLILVAVLLARRRRPATPSGPSYPPPPPGPPGAPPPGW